MGDISSAADLGRKVFSGPVKFPGINLTVNPPETFFGTSVHWYGIIIALGLIAAVLVCLRLAERNGVSQETIFDIVIFGVPSAIVCARLYYVIFRWSEYKDRLLDVFKIWEGGIAIYGGIIGAVAAVLVYCKVKKLKAFRVLDVGCVGLAIGQSIGRWGNFVNREAFGAPASSLVPWRMRLYTDLSMDTWAEVHPTFLYESLWNLGVVIILVNLLGKKKYDGHVFWTYVLSYGLGRFWIEGLRMDSLYLGPVRISQLVALCTAVLSVVIMCICANKAKKAEEELL